MTTNPKEVPGVDGLVTLLRIALGTSQRTEAATLSARADGILAQIRRHRVGGFLFQRLSRETLAGFPESFQNSLRAEALENLKRGLNRVGELRKILGRLEAEQVRVLAFKGPVTELEFYKQLGIRHVGDLDLLVHPEDLPRADEFVAELGYTRSFPPGSLTPVQWRHFIQSHHELNHRDRVRQRVVELQWALGGFPSISFETLWNERRLVAIAGTPTPVVPGELGELYLFVHGAGHRWRVLFWLVDAALLLQQRSDEQLDRLLSLARTHRVDRALLQGASVANQILGVRLPPTWHAAAHADPTVQWLSEAAVQQIVGSTQAGGGIRTMLQELHYLWRLQPTARARLAVLRPRLLSVDNWSLLPLPDALFWLYYPLAPLLWLVRQFLRRSKQSPLSSTTRRQSPAGHR